MIKGINRQVIVVRSPDRRFFEEAIFIVRDGAGGSGVTADQVVAEARRVAEHYVSRQHTHWYDRIPRLGWAAWGALLTSAVWAAALFL